MKLCLLTTMYQYKNKTLSESSHNDSLMLIFGLFKIPAIKVNRMIH